MKLLKRWPAELTVILVVYLGLALTYSVTNPLFEAPDEIWHYEYVRWLAEGNGLPVPEDVGVAPWAQEGSQPPLYYLVGAALTWPIPTDNAEDAIRYNPHAAIGDADAFGNRNMMVHGRADAWPWRGVVLAAHVARFISIALGLVTVTFTYFTARLGFPGWPSVAALAAVLVAFNPQFLFISASASNDNMVTALSAVGLWLCARLVSLHSQPGLGWLLALGLAAGLAALSKLSGLLVIGLATLTLAVVAWRVRSFGYFLRALVIFLLVVAVIAGWWYLRNWRLFGDPLALSVMFSVLPARAEAASPAELLALAPGIWRSFWAVFGWFNVAAAEWVYWIYATVTCLGLVGWLVGWLVRRSELRAALRGWPLLLFIVWSLAMGASLLRWAQISYPQGRLIFPAIGAIMALLAGGLIAGLPARWRAPGAASIGALLCGLAWLMPFVWIAPVYAPPRPVAVGTALPNSSNVGFGDSIRLVGHDPLPLEARPGEAIDLNLYWLTDAVLTKDYSLFLHATDEVGILQAQRDSYPAGGALATTEWRAGVVYPDRHQLRLAPTVPAPSLLRVDVGVYDLATGVRLPVGAGDHFTLGYVQVPPPAGVADLPNATFVNFADKLALVGYSIDKRLVSRGEPLTLRLWWQALASMDRDYVVFAHLVMPPETVWAQQDQMPQEGRFPTSTWEVGQRVEDSYALVLPPEAPPGIYAIEIGVYDKDSFERLKVDFSDRGVVLGQVKLAEGD